MLERKTFRIHKPKLDFLKKFNFLNKLGRYRNIALLALAGLIIGAAGAGLTLNGGPKESTETQEVTQTDPKQGYDSDSGGVTNPTETDVDLTPKSIKFERSTYTVNYGSKVKMRANFLDKLGQRASATGKFTVKISSKGYSKTIQVAEGNDQVSFDYKGPKAGTYTVSAEASGLKGGSAKVIVKATEKITLSASQATITSADLLASGVDLSAKNFFSDGRPIDDNIVTFSVSGTGCGGWESGNRITDDEGVATATWKEETITADTTCTITATSQTGKKATKTITVTV